MSPLSLPPPAVEKKLSPVSLPQPDKRCREPSEQRQSLEAIQQAYSIRLMEPSEIDDSDSEDEIDNIVNNMKSELIERCHAIQQENNIRIRHLRNEHMEIDNQLKQLEEEDRMNREYLQIADPIDEEEFLDSTSVISPISSPLEIEIPSQSNSPELEMILNNLRGDRPSSSSVDVQSFFLDSSNEESKNDGFVGFSDSRDDGFVGFSESKDGDGNEEHGNQEDEL